MGLRKFRGRNNSAVDSDNTDRNLGVVEIVHGGEYNQNEKVGENLSCFVAELDGDDCTSPTRSLRDTTTQDTDEPEIQHVSEPEKSA